MKPGKSSDISIQQNFDNSWRGLCYKPRKVTKDEIERLRDSHIWHNQPSLENVEMVYITVDTMDDFFSYGVFAWDVGDNICLLEDGKLQYLELDDDKRKQINSELKEAGKPPVITVEDVLNRQYLVDSKGNGITPLVMCIDQGGHRTNEVKHFAKMHKQVVMQKGTSMTSTNWKWSENQERLIISNEKHWKSYAIYMLYSQKNRNENYLYFNPSISEESIAEIRDLRPDESSKWGSDPSNWISKTGNSHCFDLIKYSYLTRDFCLQALTKNRYRFGQAPSILRRFDKQKSAEQQVQQDSVKNSWFSI